MGIFSRAVQEQSPLGSITASASRITGKNISRQLVRSEDWQSEAWDMLASIGEQRFLANTIASRMGQARIYVGKLADDPLDAPEPVEEGLPAEAMKAFGNGPISQTQMIKRTGMNLYVAGDAYLVGIPRDLMPESYLGVYEDEDDDLNVEGVNISDLVWRVCSTDELQLNHDDTVAIRLDDKNSADGDVDDFIIIRVWNPDARYSWKADSPVRSSLPVLRILSGLNLHASSQIDSRLSGNGILWIPQEISRAIKTAEGLAEDSEDDPFTDALIEAMTEPIADRESVSSVVPLTVTAPSEHIEKVSHTSFSTDLDSATQEMTENALRRLALSQDAPPEVLLGSGDANHWSAWLIKEDTIQTHLEPPLALICDALTTQYLWPLLLEQGYSREEAHQYVVWYDVSALIQRPNRSQDALTLHDRGVISAEALRDSADFTGEDRPSVHERVLNMVQADPSLVSSPGIPALFEMVKALVNKDEIPDVDPIQPDRGYGRSGNDREPESDEDADDGTGAPPKGEPEEAPNNFSAIVAALGQQGVK